MERGAQDRSEAPTARPDGPTPSAAGPGTRPAPLREPGDERERRARDEVRRVAAAAGLPTDGAGVWRAGSSVLVGLPEVPAVGRVDDPSRSTDAERQVVVSALLRERDVPAIELVDPPGGPVPTRAGPLTIWRFVSGGGDALTPERWGRAVRHLHDATRDLVGRAPAHDPLAALGAELDRAEVAGRTASADLGLLRERSARLAERWPRPDDDPLGAALVHGDLHRGNVVESAGGPVLADLELAGWGPASVDLAPQLVAVRRYGADPSRLERFVGAYGADPRGWDGLEVLVEAYELWVTAWAVANRSASPRAEGEAERRLRRWRDGSSEPWSLR